MRGRFVSPHQQSQAREDREWCANTVVGAVGDFAARRVHLVELGAVEPQALPGGADQGFEDGRNQKVEERGALRNVARHMRSRRAIYHAKGRNLRINRVNFVWNCHSEREQERISQGFMPGGAAATHDFFGMKLVISL